MNEPNPNPISTTNAYTKRATKPPQPPLYVPPNHTAFRLLCHASRIGGLIGKSGSIIKQIQQLTNSKIRVDDPCDGGDHRVVAVISPLNAINRITLCKSDEDGDDVDLEWYDVSPAQEGLIKVFERVVEVAADGDETERGRIEGLVSCRLLMWRNQGGAVIGKGGSVVEKIRMDTGTRIVVFDGDVVEIEGDILAVKKAIIAVTSRLQECPPFDKTRTYSSRPLEVESLPNQTVDLPMQRSPILQPVPLNSVNHAPTGHPSFLERVQDIDSRTQQQEVVFKILCPNERVGSILGKEGYIHKALQNETGAKIIIGPYLTDCHERLITVSAVEIVKSKYSPAQNAAILVFKRFMEDGVAKGLTLGSQGTHVSARIMVSSSQVGCLLGKGGVIISEMRKMTGTRLRLLGGHHVPQCASENDEVLEITGEYANVQEALYKVTSRLRDNTFWIKMSNGNQNPVGTKNRAYNSVRDTTPVGSHVSISFSNNLNEHTSLNEEMDRLGISININQPAKPSLESHTSSRANSENVTDINSRLTSAKGGVELGSGNRSAAFIKNTTVEIVVPDTAIGLVYGKDGSNLARLQQISGAKVIVHEPHHGTTERTLVISGTPDETRAAQSLLQAFMLAGS